MIHFYSSNMSVCSEFISHSCFLSFLIHFPALSTFSSPLEHCYKLSVATSQCGGCKDLKKKRQARKNPGDTERMECFFPCRLVIFCGRSTKLNTEKAFLLKTGAVWKNQSSLSQRLSQKKSHFKLKRTDANMAAGTKRCLWCVKCQMKCQKEFLN